MKCWPRIFRPVEVLFALTDDCVLACPHCARERSGRYIDPKIAARFLKNCKDAGIKRVGFTGGEPFLASDALCALVKKAVSERMLFGKIMTSGVWFATKKELDEKLRRLFKAGYDGDICVSVDAFHKQDIRKLSLFINTALPIWRRPDMVSVAYVTGSRERETREKLKRLKRFLHKPFFIRVHKIRLSAAGKAGNSKDAWDGKWFKEDHCKGPGNIFFVSPGGSVRPCCGYAPDSPALDIGNIRTDAPGELVKNFERNRFVRTVFRSGLSRIRKRLEKAGFVFPGRTSDHCFFCDFLLNEVPKDMLKRCLN